MTEPILIPAKNEPPLEMRLDIEHFGIRALTFTFLIGGGIGGFLLGQTIGNQIDPTFPYLCLSLPLAIVLAAVLANISDRVIKPYWGSGRVLQVSQDAIIMHDRRRLPPREKRISIEDYVEVKTWYFVVNKGTRVPKGWYCASLFLKQNDEKLTVYAFINPKTATENPTFRDYFTHLLPRKKREALVATDPQLATRMSMLRELEGSRWFEGAELQEEDFWAVVMLLELHFNHPSI